MDPETSIEVIRKNWPRAHELYNRAKNSHTAAIAQPAQDKLDMYAEFGKRFLKMLFTEEKIFVEDFEETLRYLSNDVGIGKFPFDYIMGFSLFDSFKNSDSIKKILKLVKSRYGEEETKNTTFDIDDSSDEEEPENKKFENYLNSQEPKMKEEEINVSKDDSLDDNDISINFGASLEEDGQNDVSLAMDQNEYNRDDFEVTDPEVYEHLIKLTKATTELSYLCQHMKWSQPDSEQKKSELNPNLFAAHMEVLVRAKHGKGVIISGDCMAAQSKKEARRVAALFILRKIFHFIPEVWKDFKRICEKQKGIEQPMTGNNEQIFNKAKLDVLNLSMFKEPIKQEKNETEIKISNYLDGITSFKNQLNLLVGKNKKITQPEFKRDKQDELGLWPVEVSIFDEQSEIKAEAKDSSKKKAEEKACRQLLFQIYKRSVQRWEDFKAHKKAKNID